MASRKMPTCRRCGRDHYNMVACDEWDEYAASLERKKQDAHRRKFARVEWKHPLPEGERVWGDSFDSVQRVGVNRFVRVRGEDFGD